MNQVQLFIEDQRVDLFDTETIQMNLSIQNVRDISAVFTDFSRSFVVPASDSNNKIFKHFYSPYINNGFDARKRKDAEIHLNHAPFKIGKVFLEGVDMRDNKPYSYRITFYGNLVSLKDKLSDDKLVDLSYLSNFNHDYGASNVKTGLTDGLDFTVGGVSKNDAIIYPLITSSKRLFFNSGLSGSDPENTEGNLYHDSNSPDTTRGLEFTDLKPAIKCIHIIEAIEDKYDLSFTRDFFDTAAFSNLYLWLSNISGEIDEQDDSPFSYQFTSETVYSSTIASLFPRTKTDISEFTNDSGTFTIVKTGSETGLEYHLGAAVNLFGESLSADARVRFLNVDTNEETIIPYYNPSTNITQRESRIQVISSSDPVGTTVNYKVFLEANQEVTPLAFLVFATRDIDPSSIGSEDKYEAFSTPASPPPTTQVKVKLTGNDNESYFVPDLKVIDFLTGIFKLFNLTAFYIDDRSDANFGKIKVETLDNFYADGVTKDISRLIDTSNHKVNTSLPFSSINFQYDETNAINMEHHKNKFNQVFGDLDYTIPDTDFKKEYNLELPFGHLKYERLLDTAPSPLESSAQTLIQWGYSAGGDFNEDTGNYDSENIPPLLFYGINISIPDSAEYINWISTSPPTGLSSYWKPSNSNENGTPETPPSFSINFDAEIDEWQLKDYGLSTNSIFNKFYTKYITSVFDVSKRIVMYTAYLDHKALHNLKLNDQFKVHDTIFRINSIEVNLNTGRAELELINLNSDEIV